MTIIRRIHADEAPVVRELYRAAVAEDAERWPEAGIAISERGLANMEAHFRAGAAHEDVVCLVAVDGAGEPIGFADAWVNRGPGTLPGAAGEIESVWARPEARSDGLERRLAEAAIAWVCARGAGAVFTMTAIEDDTREPWQELGFERDVARWSLYE